MQSKRIRKILLVTPPGSIHVQPDGSRQVKECPPPLGLAYLAAQVLKNCDCEVRVYDMIIENFHQETRESHDIILYGESFEQYGKVLEDFEPDVVGVSCILSSRSKSALKLCRMSKEFDQDIITAVGGHHATALPEHLLQGGADYVFLGESDHSFPKFINAINNDGDISGVDGIVYRNKENGTLILQERKNYVKKLDSLPRPAWHVVGLEKYWKGYLPMGIPLKENRYAVVSASRGCPHICDYCAVPKHCGERNFRARNLNDVIDEIRYLVADYGIKEIQFLDDNFFVNRKRVKKLLRLLISNFPGMYFAVPTGTDLPCIDFEMIDLLKEAGFYFMMLGIETGSMDIQGKYVDKKIDIEETREKVRYMKEVGLEVSGFFLIGFPGETREQVQKTINLATSLDLDRIYFPMLTPLPGSRLYDRCLENDLLYDDFDVTKTRYSNTFIKNPNISREELEGIRRDVWREYMSKRTDS